MNAIRVVIVVLSILGIAFFGWLTILAFGNLTHAVGWGEIIGWAIATIVLLLIDLYVFLAGIIFSFVALLAD